MKNPIGGSWSEGFEDSRLGVSSERGLVGGCMDCGNRCGGNCCPEVEELPCCREVSCCSGLEFWTWFLGVSVVLARRGKLLVAPFTGV